VKTVKRYRYSLRLDAEDKRRVDAVVKASGRTINQVLVLSLRSGLPLAEDALCRKPDRLTNVEPIPDEVWRRIYSRGDELDGLTGHQLKAAQSQEDPQ
jgi:hypothetical protein